jgi:hypothetical protein
MYVYDCCWLNIKIKQHDVYTSENLFIVYIMLSDFAHSRKMVSKNTFDTLLTC